MIICYFFYTLGRRICVGENLAKMELYLFFTHLLHRFTFRGTDMQSEEDHGSAPKDFQVTAIRRD